MVLQSITLLTDLWLDLKQKSNKQTSQHKLNRITNNFIIRYIVIHILLSITMPNIPECVKGNLLSHIIL